MDCKLILSITALACAIADQTPDNNELVLLASVLVQLSDTLNTIVAQRELCEELSEPVLPPP